MLPDWFEELMDEAREFEESGGLDKWLQDVAENGTEEQNERLDMMGL